MAAIKRFFEKKKLEFKFKTAGEGHKLTEDTRTRDNASTSSQARPQSVRRQTSSDAAQNARQAALARMQQTNTGSSFGTSSAAIKAQVKHEMEAQKKAQSQAQRLAEVYSERKEINIEASPLLAVSGVYFKSAVTGDVVLPRDEMQDHIKEFLYSQLAEEPQLTSALMIYTLNKDPDKIKVCVETLCKYLDNIVNHPGEEKFRKIRVNNKAFQERVVQLEGTEMFLQSAGFTHKSLPGPNETPEDFLVMDEENAATERLESLKEILVTAEPIRPELDRNLRVYIAAGNVSQKMEVPNEFYNISPEELKREIQAKNEAVERLGMLRTKEMRERERLRELRRYRYCLIRIRFPDSMILQGTFRAVDKFSAVLEFVRESLQLDWIPFVLTGLTGTKYTDDSLTLAELDLAPAAVLHCSYDSNVLQDVQKQGMQVKNYLRDDLLALAMSL